MANSSDPAVPVEIIVDLSDRMPQADAATDRVAGPGEGLVDCTIICEFVDSGNPNSSARNGTPEPSGTPRPGPNA